MSHSKSDSKSSSSSSSSEYETGEMGLVGQLFTWEEWEEYHEFGDASFEDITLRTAVGDFPAGSKFERALWLPSKGECTLENRDGSSITLKLGLSFTVTEVTKAGDEERPSKKSKKSNSIEIVEPVPSVVEEKRDTEER